MVYSFQVREHARLGKGDDTIRHPQDIFNHLQLAVSNDPTSQQVDTLLDEFVAALTAKQTPVTVQDTPGLNRDVQPVREVLINLGLMLAPYGIVLERYTPTNDGRYRQVLVATVLHSEADFEARAEHGVFHEGRVN